MRRQRFTLLLLLLTAALRSVSAHAEAVSFRVRVVSEGNSSNSPVPVEIQILGGASGTGQTETIIKSEAPAVVAVELTQPGIWYARARASGYWGETRVIPTPHRGEAIELRLWHIATLRAEIPASAQVSKIGVRFQPVTDDGQPANTFPAGTNDCRIDGRRVECAIPAGRSDYSLVAVGYVPVYRWDQIHTSGQIVNLGKVDLRKGASLVGRVTLAPGSPLLKGSRVRVTLEPRNAGIVAPADELRSRISSTTIFASSRGNFAFEGIKPGGYLLSASAAPNLISEAREVSILDTLEAELRDPLELSRPHTLAILIQPPMDPWGSRWIVDLVKLDRRNRQSFSVANSVADRDGAWSKPNLAPAEYLLSIRREPQGVWHSQALTLVDDTRLDVQIPLTRIAGSLKLGDSPLAGSLWFGGERGEIAVPVTTNTEGRFQGIIPAAPDRTWSQVDVTAEHPTVRRTLRDVVIPEPNGEGISPLDFTLPSSKIYGEVTTERGAPIHTATVFLSTPGETGELLQTHADEGGQFSFNGLPAGQYSLRALVPSGKSGTVDVSIDETSIEYVTLLVKKNAELRGSVSSRYGGIAGARVSSYPDDRSGFDLVEWNLTDTEGRFSVPVSPTARAVTLTVAAPGFPFHFFRSAVDAEKPIPIQVEQNGGRLQITTRGGVYPFLFHGGGFLALQDLIGDGVASLEGSTATIENLQPGHYEVCAATAAEALAFAQTMRPAERCGNGLLAPGGHLVLALPGN